MAQTKFDLYSRSISNSAVAEFDAEPDPQERLRKYVYTITSSEQAAIEAQFREAETQAHDEATEGPVTIDLDPDVAAHFSKEGGDWHRRINEVLRAAIKRH